MASREERAAAGGRTGKRRPLMGLFRSRADAERAIGDLRKAGFRDDQMSVVAQDTDATRARNATTTDRGDVVAAADRDDTRTAAKDRDDPGAAVAKGAATGAAIGGLVGLLGALLIPGAGPLVLGGVIASTLVGMGAGAATGGLVGLLTTMGATAEEARYFDSGVQQGNVLVIIEPGDRQNEARILLVDAGADLGPTPVAEIDVEVADETEPWRGNERRYHDDASYTGPERRTVRAGRS